MQVKVNLTPSDCQAIRDFLDNSNPVDQPTWLAKLMPKLAKAIEQPAKPAKRSTKNPFSRADLKGQLEQAHGGHYRFIEGAKGAAEPCVHCCKPLNRARLTRLGNGAVEGIGHLACAMALDATQRARLSKAPTLAISTWTPTPNRIPPTPRLWRARWRKRHKGRNPLFPRRVQASSAC